MTADPTSPGRPGDPPAPADGYVARRRRLVLQRLRVVSLVAIGAVCLAAVLNCWAYRDDELWEHLATLAIQAALMVGAIVLARVPGADRHGETIAGLVSTGIGAVQLWAIVLAGTNVDLMLSAVLAVMLVPMFAFAWGPAPQVVLSTLIGAGYLWIVPWGSLDRERIANLAIGTLTGYGVSVCGVCVLDRHRRATWIERERVAALARHRQLLLEIGRRLNGTMNVDALVLLIAQLGQEAVGCDETALTLIDRAAKRNRTVTIRRGRSEPVHLEFPFTLRIPSLAGLLAHRGVVEVPGDADLEALIAINRRHGIGRTLLAPIERGGEHVGILAFNQVAADRPFTEAQRLLAEGIAQQAAVALANAHLVGDLQEASRVKSEFLSTMSHELRTPLNVILGFAEMGGDAVAGEGALGRYFAKIDAAGRDLLELVDSTLAIGRLEAGRDGALLVATRLRPAWQSIREVCERFPCDAAVRLDWSDDVPDMDLLTDARKLQVVLRNLVGNALKFTAAGVVRVEAWREADTLVIAVADTGIGIPAADQETIFEMFRQADGSDTRRHGGTGLGLYIVRQYVRQLGGTVAVESRPGAGSTFTVRLPVDQGTRRAA